MAASSIATKAWGKSRPIAPNRKADGSDDAAGSAKNRRVEIWLVS
jgi:OOP family OmpA-OmpF porin